ncbi:MAG: GNAT family N-acetyltransferase [Acidobacteria bacterium]|nr:GNAT family N-acetyltransferase [Acidobacteriota bacterium]
MEKSLEIRECTTLDEMVACVDLQREVFALPEVELSPVRHFVVTRNAGGFVLGAYSDDELIGFVLSVPAFLRDEKAFYSHMTAVRADFQSHGVGAKLKWAQRARALELGVEYVKWTFEPWKARNAYFNLEKLGAVMSEYARNFYGTDYSTAAQTGSKIGLASDRLFAEWHLKSDKVEALAAGEKWVDKGEPLVNIAVPNDWFALLAKSTDEALAVQARIRRDFELAFGQGLVARGFLRDEEHPTYLLY